MKSSKLKLLEPLCLILLSTSVLIFKNMSSAEFLLPVFVSLFLLFGLGLSILQFSELNHFMFKVLLAVALSVAVVVCLSTVMVYIKNWQVSNVLLVLVWLSLSLSLFRLSILYKGLVRPKL